MANEPKNRARGPGGGRMRHGVLVTSLVRRTSPHAAYPTARRSYYPEQPTHREWKSRREIARARSRLCMPAHRLRRSVHSP